MMSHSHSSFASTRKRTSYGAAASNRRRSTKPSFIPNSTPSIQKEPLLSCHKCGVHLKISNCTAQFKESLMQMQRNQYNVESSGRCIEVCPLDDYMENVLSDAEQEFKEELREDDHSILVAGVVSPGSESNESNHIPPADGRRHRKATENSITSNASSDNEGNCTGVIISEEVWENQWLDADSKWPEGDREVDRVLFSDFFGLVRSSTELGVLQARTFNDQWEWVSEWEIDRTLEGCDTDGWVYASSVKDHFMRPNTRVRTVSCMSEVSVDEKEFAHTDNMEFAQTLLKEKASSSVRRRRLLRSRRYGSNGTSWYIELVNCASAITKVDYPLCHQCEAQAYSELECELAQVKDDLASYTDFITELERESIVLSNSGDQSAISESGMDSLTMTSLESLEAEEHRLSMLVEECEEEWNVLRSERKVYSVFARELQQLQEECFAEVCAAQLSQQYGQEECQSTGVFFEHAVSTLKRLRRYNVYNDAFHIWHEGPFGTINGLKLGRLPSRPVEWHELNAALGQAAMLLATIADCAGIHFMNYRVIPRGSFSKVGCLDGREYPLYSDGSFLKRRGFNHAMVWFLECIDEAGKMALHEEPTLQLPYRIEKGKIGDLSVCLGDDEEWTRALKYMLTHLKWLLAWVAKHHP